MTCFSWLDKRFCALLIMLVRGYQLTLSPWLGRGCRFTPSCSQYCIDALRQRGFITGTWLTARRLVRCQPWCEGGYDPVPSNHPN